MPFDSMSKILFEKIYTPWKITIYNRIVRSVQVVNAMNQSTGMHLLISCKMKFSTASLCPFQTLQLVFVKFSKVVYS